MLTPGRTVIVPIDPARAVVTRSGAWVGAAPGTSARAHGRIAVTLELEGSPDAPAIPVCPAGRASDPCALDPGQGSADLDLAIDVANTGTPHWVAHAPGRSEACACIVVLGLSTDRDPEADEKECDDETMAPELWPMSYLGGVLYETGWWDNDGCSGAHLADGVERRVVLRPGATPLDLSAPPAMTCIAGAPDRGMAIDDVLDEAPCGADGGCETCEVADEMSAYAIRRGRLVHARGSVGSPEEACTCIAMQELSPDLCPTPLDPCGDPRRFPELAEVPRLWVDTEERVALAASSKGLQVFRRGHPSPLRTAEPIDEIIGVEHHRDTALLDLPDVPSSVRVAIPALDPRDEAFEGSARQWGERCFVHWKEHRLGAAEAACFAGLAEGGSERTRGAIAYNLGRIAETQNDRDRAIAFYRRSLALRPDHPTVKARLDALRSPATHD